MLAKIEQAHIDSGAISWLGCWYGKLFVNWAGQILLLHDLMVFFPINVRATFNNNIKIGALSVIIGEKKDEIIAHLLNIVLPIALYYIILI